MPLSEMKFAPTPQSPRVTRAAALVDDAQQQGSFDREYAGRVLREMETLVADAERAGDDAEAEILDQESRVLRRTLAALRGGT